MRLLLRSDLKGANVLIKSVKVTEKDSRGYVCKLADFGLARVLGSNRTHVSTSTHGECCPCHHVCMSCFHVPNTGCAGDKCWARRRLYWPNFT